MQAYSKIQTFSVAKLDFHWNVHVRWYDRLCIMPISSHINPVGTSAIKGFTTRHSIDASTCKVNINWDFFNIIYTWHLVLYVKVVCRLCLWKQALPTSEKKTYSSIQHLNNQNTEPKTLLSLVYEMQMKNMLFWWTVLTNFTILGISV